MEKKPSLGLMDLVWMNLVAIIGLRWIAVAAGAGPVSLFLWPLAALVFFIPQAVGVLTLSSLFPQEEGGLYFWTKKAFGEFHGFVCGWCYWVNNLFYFPSLLMFVASNLGFLGMGLLAYPELEKSKLFVVSVTLTILWTVAFFNFIGPRYGKWLQNIGGMTTWIPGVILILLGLAVYLKRGSANTITLSTIIPNSWNREKISFFAEICFGFAGFELATFLTKDIKDPQKNIAKSILPSAIVIAIVYIGGTLAALLSIPQDQINSMNGILRPITEVGKIFGLESIAFFTAALLVLGGIGGTLSWFQGAGRLPYVVGVDRYLPPSFAKLHPRFQTPYISIFTQVMFATLFTLIATAGSGTGLETGYNILVDMGIILYFIPYLYLFLSLFFLTRKKNLPPVPFPGAKFIVPLSAVLGFASTTLAIVMATLPSAGEDKGVSLFKVLGGSFFMLSLGLGLYFRKGSWGKKNFLSNQNSPEEFCSEKGLNSRRFEHEHEHE